MTVQEHGMLVVAECESCGNAWLITTHVEPNLLEGVCVDSQSDINCDVERPLTFREPSAIELRDGTVDQKMTAWVARAYDD
jgi:hypothetical protein